MQSLPQPLTHFLSSMAARNKVALFFWEKGPVKAWTGGSGWKTCTAEGRSIQTVVNGELAPKSRHTAGTRGRAPFPPGLWTHHCWPPPDTRAERTLLLELQPQLLAQWRWDLTAYACLSMIDMMVYEEPFLPATFHSYSPASLHTDVCV